MGPLKATRCKEVAGYTGPDAAAPSMEDMNKQIVEKVVKATLQEIKLKNGSTAMTLFSDDSTHLHINPSGKFIIGGPQGDAGLTGRKIIIDTYGVGVRMVVAHSLARIPRRWTVQPHTSAGRWRSPSLRVAWPSGLWSSSLTPLVSRNRCRFSWKLMAQSAGSCQPTTSPTL